MYQSQAYQPYPASTGCCGCFGGGMNAQVLPQGYGYDQYNQVYDPYSQAALTTSLVAPVNLTPVAAMPPQVYGNQMVGANDLYQSRTIQAPPLYNKAVVNTPATTSRIQYVPYEVKQIVYDTVEKVQVIPVQKTITEYQQVKHIQTYPVEKMVTDYYAVEFLTEFMPQVHTDRVTDYVHQEVINQTVNYVPREMQRIVPAGQVAPVVAPMAPVMPAMLGTGMARSIVTPNIPAVASIASLPPSVANINPMYGSAVTPGLNMSQGLLASNGSFGYGMGPTVGTVVGSMNRPAYGVTAITG